MLAHGGSYHGKYWGILFKSLVMGTGIHKGQLLLGLRPEGFPGLFGFVHHTFRAQKSVLFRLPSSTLLFVSYIFRRFYFSALTGQAVSFIGLYLHWVVPSLGCTFTGLYLHWLYLRWAEACTTFSNLISNITWGLSWDCWELRSVGRELEFGQWWTVSLLRIWIWRVTKLTNNVTCDVFLWDLLVLTYHHDS